MPASGMRIAELGDEERARPRGRPASPRSGRPSARPSTVRKWRERQRRRPEPASSSSSARDGSRIPTQHDTPRQRITAPRGLRLPSKRRTAIQVAPVARAGDRDSSPGKTALSGNAIRRIVIEQSKRANVGHIGSRLSIADIARARSTAACCACRRPTIPSATASSSPRATRRSPLYAALHLRGLARRRAELDTLLRRRQPARRASRARAPRRRLLDRLARPRALARRGRGARRAPAGLARGASSC